jgi:hypothetical protein
MISSCAMDDLVTTGSGHSQNYPRRQSNFGNPRRTLSVSTPTHSRSYHTGRIRSGGIDRLRPSLTLCLGTGIVRFWAARWPRHPLWMPRLRTGRPATLCLCPPTGHWSPPLPRGSTRRRLANDTLSCHSQARSPMPPTPLEILADQTSQMRAARFVF